MKKHLSTRLQKAKKLLSPGTALYISKTENVYYLSEFNTSNGHIILTKKQAYFFTDSRYTEAAEKNLPKEFQLIKYDQTFFQNIEKILKKNRITTLEFEAHDLTHQKYLQYKKHLKGIKLTPNKTTIESLRLIKDEREIKLINKAQQITEKVFYETIKYLKTGITEIELGNVLKKLTLDLGAEDVSFSPIIGFGPGSSEPHHENSTRKFKPGDMVLIDMGVKYQNYCSDMTRTFFTKPPTPQQQAVYQTVLNAQLEAMKHLRTGSVCEKIDKIARNVITKAGYGDKFGHSLGHGIGLEVHESAHLGPRSQIKLPFHTIVTVEPGIYLENSFGVRIEDMVLIEQEKAVNLTLIPKKIEDMIFPIK